MKSKFRRCRGHARANSHGASISFWMLAALLAALIVVQLQGCGGGGGGGGTSERTGIAENYYPVTTGSVWNYDGTSSGSSATYLDEILVTGSRTVSGQNAQVFLESNALDTGVASESYYAKNTRAFTYLGDNSSASWLTAAIGPFEQMRFDGSFSASPLVDKIGTSIGQDFDSDGISELLDVRVTGVVEGYETRATPAGSFSNTARLRYDVSGTVRFSTGISLPVSQTVREWRAPGVGMIAQVLTSSVAGVSSSDTMTLRGLSVNGVVGGVLSPKTIASGLAAADSDVTRPGRPAVATDGTRFLVVTNRQTLSGRQWMAQWVGVDGIVQSSIDLSSPLTNLSWSPAAAWDGTNYLIVTGAGGLGAQRVNAAGGVIDAYPGTALAADGFNPALAYGSATYLLVYRRSSALGTIYGQLVAPSGVAGTEFVIASNAADYASPAVAFDGSNFLVAWESGVGLAAPQNTNLHAARVSPTGVLLDAVPFAVSQAGEAQTSPQIACDGTNCLISWVDRRNYPGASYSFSPGPGDMYGCFVSKTGVLLNGPANTGGLALATGITANQGYPAIAFTGTEYLLAWSRGAFVNNPGGPTGIFVARVSISGTAGSAINVSGLPAGATTLPYLALAAGPAGGLVAWLNNTETTGAVKSVNGAIIQPLVSR